MSITPTDIKIEISFWTKRYCGKH